jgi:hypothetical protein
VALQAVILNRAMSLIIVLTALPARLLSIPSSEVAGHRSIKIEGNLSLTVSLPTVLVAFARYSRGGSSAVLGARSAPSSSRWQLGPSWARCWAYCCWAPFRLSC